MRPPVTPHRTSDFQLPGQSEGAVLLFKVVVVNSLSEGKNTLLPIVVTVLLVLFVGHRQPCRSWLRSNSLTGRVDRPTYPSVHTSPPLPTGTILVRVRASESDPQGCVMVPFGVSCSEFPLSSITPPLEEIKGYLYHSHRTVTASPGQAASRSRLRWSGNSRHPGAASLTVT